MPKLFKFNHLSYSYHYHAKFFPHLQLPTSVHPLGHPTSVHPLEHLLLSIPLDSLASSHSPSPRAASPMRMFSRSWTFLEVFAHCICCPCNFSLSRQSNNGSVPQEFHQVLSLQPPASKSGAQLNSTLTN